MESFRFIKPIFLPGAIPDNLLNTNVMAGISILPKSPLLTPKGSFQLVSFLGSLPKPSLIILVDELNRHNIKAMAKSKQMPSDNKAIDIALKSGDEYHQVFTKALNLLELEKPANASKITLLRWNDVEDIIMKKQQEVFENYYKSNNHFKLRIGKLVL